MLYLRQGMKGVFNCNSSRRPYMMEQRYGKIINISSVAGMGVSPPQNECNANYAATKASLIQLTKTFARELGPYGINVNSIAPGFHLKKTSASFTTREEQRAGEQHVGYREKLAVLGRGGRPEDIANRGSFLASDDPSSFISGRRFVSTADVPTICEVRVNYHVTRADGLSL